MALVTAAHNVKHNLHGTWHLALGTCQRVELIQQQTEQEYNTILISNKKYRQTLSVQNKQHTLSVQYTLLVKAVAVTISPVG
jgi:hypothetical protein